MIEELPGAPDVGPAKRWIYGLALAALPIAYGAWCIATQHIILRSGRGPRAELTGAPAIALGAVAVCIGLFLHFHFLWRPHERLWRVGRIGKTVSLLGILAGLGWFFFWFVQIWRHA
jgi:hypothetical protein